MGPLPETDTGNKYIMVVGDYFTKWSEAYAIPNQEAKIVAVKLVKEFICRYGAPEKIHSDQVPNERKGAAPASGQQSTCTTPGSCRPQPYAAYVPDETDLMYMDESVADPEPEMSQEANRQGEVPEQPQPVRGPGTPVQVRPRREIREPAWMQDFVS